MELTPGKRLRKFGVVDMQSWGVDGGDAGLLLQATVQPTLCRRLRIEPRRLPDSHGAEMGSVRVRVAHALDDGELPLLVKFGQAGQDWVQTDAIVDLVNRIRRHMDPRTVLAVVVIAVRDDRVEPVVPPGELQR